MLSFLIVPISFDLKSILGTGCREYYPGQWTYDWTPEFGQQEWFNFDDAWTACCRSIVAQLVNFLIISEVVQVSTPMALFQMKLLLDAGSK